MLSFVKKIITFLSSRIFWHNFLFILTNLLLHYLFSHFNILIIMMTIDNIYLAGNFLKNIFDENISESQIIISNNKLYSIGVIERYTCYIFFSIVLFFLKNFILNCNFLILDQLFILITIPYILNNCIYHNFEFCFDVVTNYKYQLIKNVCIEQLVILIINLSKTYYGKNIKLDKQEMIDTLLQYQNLNMYINNFIRNSLVVSLMIYLRRSSKICYKLSKYFYFYNTGEYMTNITLSEARTHFKKVIENSRFDQLCHPMTIQSMIYLYYCKNNSDIMQTIIKKINFRIVLMFSLWTIGSLFTDYITIYSVVVTSCCISIFKNYIRNKKKHIVQNFINEKIIVSTFTTILLGLPLKNPFLISLINQFSDIIIINPLTKSLTKTIFDNVVSNTSKLNQMIHFDKRILISYFLVVILYALSNLKHFEMNLIIPIMFNVTQNFKFEYKQHKKYNYDLIMYLILYVSLINNKMNILKMLIVSYVVSCIDNIVIFVSKYRDEKISESVVVVEKKNKIIPKIKCTRFEGDIIDQNNRPRSKSMGSMNQNRIDIPLDNQINIDEEDEYVLI